VELADTLLAERHLLLTAVTVAVLVAVEFLLLMLFSALVRVEF
jgi:hypothetical protein